MYFPVQIGVGPGPCCLYREVSYIGGFLYRDFTVVKLLIAHGADVITKGGIFGSALQTAASQGALDIVKLLLENGADVNAKKGDLGVYCRLLLTEGNWMW